MVVNYHGRDKDLFSVCRTVILDKLLAHELSNDGGLAHPRRAKDSQFDILLLRIDGQMAGGHGDHRALFRGQGQAARTERVQGNRGGKV
jgi:hypothetical protein